MASSASASSVVGSASWRGPLARVATAWGAARLCARNGIATIPIPDDVALPAQSLP